MKLHKRITIETLLRTGTSQREIARVTGVDRKTIRGYARAVNPSGVATGVEADEAQTPPPRPPALSAVARSAGECHRDWIAQQVALGRNAQSIYQDLVERFAFTPPLQLGQALRPEVKGARARTLRCPRLLARRGGAGRLGSGRANPSA